MEVFLNKPYYAVLCDPKHTGVYRDSSEFLKYVHGVKGARVRKCSTEQEARKYLNNPELFSTGLEYDSFNKYANYVYSTVNSYAIAYVDGSFNCETGYYGYGGFLDDGRVRYIVTGKGNDADKVNYNAIAGEILGVIAIIEKAMSLNIEDIIIFYDCSAIEEWLREPKDIKNAFKNEYYSFIENARKKGISIIFKKVKAHSNDKGNEIADRLAKEAVGIVKRKPLPLSFFNVREAKRFNEIYRKDICPHFFTEVIDEKQG